MNQTHIRSGGLCFPPKSAPAARLLPDLRGLSDSGVPWVGESPEGVGEAREIAGDAFPSPPPPPQPPPVLVLLSQSPSQVRDPASAPTRGVPLATASGTPKIAWVPATAALKARGRHPLRSSAVSARVRPPTTPRDPPTPTCSMWAGGVAVRRGGVVRARSRRDIAGDAFPSAVEPPQSASMLFLVSNSPSQVRDPA